MDKYSFQNCQKLVIFSKDKKSVLLARRKDEKDLNGIFSFVGGKMEVTDKSLLAGMKREKDEEVGSDFKIRIYPTFAVMAYFEKKDGNHMILPHYFAEHVSGKVKLNEEYSEFKWVPIKELDSFEPKIPTIPGAVASLLKIKDHGDYKII